jgi:signal recognition particle receptor subunit beta
MVLFNYSTRELTAKIVYYGPGLCGKTTNLQFVHEKLPETVKGKMLSLATKTDRTLFFDFLPIDLGEIRGMKTRVQLYTVPGQVFYNETRRLVLKGADGVVFVADSQAAMMDANVDSLRNLEENLRAHGMNLQEMPLVLQYNKRDLANLSSVEELNAKLNKYKSPFFESVATTGLGVQETLKAVTKLVLLHLTRKYDPRAQTSTARLAGAAPAPRAAAPRPAAPPPAAASVPAAAAASAGGEALGRLKEQEVAEMLEDVREGGGEATATATVSPATPTMPPPAPPDDFELDEQAAADAEPEPAAVRRTAAPRPSTEPVGAGPTPAVVLPVAGGDGAASPVDVVPAAPATRSAISLKEVPADDALFRDEDLEVAVLRPDEEKEILVPVRIEADGRVLHYRLSMRLSVSSASDE